MAAITGRYDYTDAAGNLLYWKVRIEPGRDGSRKEFAFYHGEKEFKRGTDPILYNLPNVIKSKAVIITEGEKQADILTQWGLCGTSLDSGAGSRITAEMIAVLAGKRIAILRDNDDPGLSYAVRISEAIHAICESVRIVLLSDLPEKGDLCDWHGDKAQLIAEIKYAAEYVPLPKVAPVKRIVPQMGIGTITAAMIEAAKQYPIDKLIEFQNGKAPCFSHKENTASLSYDRQNNRCRCFGCGGSWDSIDILRSRDSMNFATAVRYLQ